MPTFSSWGSGEGQPLAIAAIISYKSIATGTITRGTTTVATKTVRLETLSSQRQVQGEGGKTYTIDAMLLAPFASGFLPGDRFSIASVAYEVEIVLPGHTDCEQVMLRVRR